MVDMTTSQPSLAVEIYEQAKKKGVFSLDAPGIPLSGLSLIVSGGDIGARDAKLSIMVGGDKDIYEKMIPLFKVCTFFPFLVLVYGNKHQVYGNCRLWPTYEDG